MQVGTTKDQGLYNKPSAAVHPGALATGTLLQYLLGFMYSLAYLDKNKFQKYKKFVTSPHTFHLSRPRGTGGKTYICA